MDRQTLANAATRISKQFALSQEQYGNLEFGFGWAFAVGSLLFGIAVDRFPVRWVYPAALALWSATGFLTGLVRSYEGLLLCRTFLGLFEAGHWPCAIKTTQRLLGPGDRAMGNSLLQSGTSIGAVITPLVMRAMMTPELGTWRWPFLVVGACGALWVIAWLVVVRPHDLTPAAPVLNGAALSGPAHEGLCRVLCTRRMMVILAVVALINSGWQTIRAWLPKFLQEGRGYSEAAALYFNSAFYVATDVGVIGAGALTLWLCRRKFSVNNSRLLAFGGCALLSACSIFIPVLPAGWLLLALLLAVGAGALGVFGIYHAFSQDISAHHQGKVTGVAGIAAWAFAPPAQKFFGRLVDTTKSFDAGFVVAGLLPLAALVVLWLFWGRQPEDQS
jgi:MFS family permease